MRIQESESSSIEMREGTRVRKSENGNDDYQPGVGNTVSKEIRGQDTKITHTPMK